MKYVRTEDELCPIAMVKEKIKGHHALLFPNGETRYSDDDDILNLGCPKCLSFWLRKEHVLKEADTIEELCDIAACFFKYEKYKIPDLRLIGKHLYDDIKIGCFRIVYGAILTDKGIIYVAKMNEKGELELL